MLYLRFNFFLSFYVKDNIGKSQNFPKFAKKFMMADFYDITKWNEKPFFNTKGTRNKCVVSEPFTGDEYFFKTSILKEGKDYKTEFWSEIIASKVGQFLGFNVLDYNIAKHGEEIGCISKSMIKDGECLTEGVSLLTGYDNTYHPEDKGSYSLYTFHFIKAAIDSFNLSSNIEDIIKTIIFDALIGNSDRHQENWGFVTPYQEQTFTLNEARSFLTKLKNGFKQIQELIQSKNIKESSIESIKLKILQINGVFSPIYDSGCCLAREKNEDSIKQMLNDKIMFDSFINRGKSEIRWGDKGEKLNHFKLVERIRKEYPNIVDSTIKNVVSRYDMNKVHDIVFNIDNSLPQDLKKEHSLSLERKELICKLLDERFIRLKNILS